MQEAHAGDLDAKNFQALLKGLSSILFFQSPTRPTEDDITYDFLHSEVFRSSSLDTPQQRQVMDGVELLLRHAADNDMSSEQLQDFLAGTRLTKDNIKCFTKFWAKEKERIHVATLRFRGMSRQFAGLKWRVASSYQGTTAQAEGEAPYLHPTAMVRMDVADSGGIEELTFQMDRPMLDKMLGALQTIQGRIEVAPG